MTGGPGGGVRGSYSGAPSSDGDVRMLRRLYPMLRSEAAGVRPDMLIGCALDVETTGLDHRRDAVIELALQRFWANRDGRIVATGRPHRWVEDPGMPLTDEVTRLTGLVSGDLAGRAIFDPVAATLIADAHFVVAHNAAFDRGFVERRLPATQGRPWVCSMRDVPWRELGFEGRTLSHLLVQMGWFYEAHRASTDVDALLHLLDHRLGDGRTILRLAVDAAVRATLLVEAIGAPFAAKDVLKARGYRWDALTRLWAREIEMNLLDDELSWAGAQVYSGPVRLRARPITWNERYSSGF